MLLLLLFLAVQLMMLPNSSSPITIKIGTANKTETNYRQKRTFFESMLGFLWVAQLFTKIAAQAPYGISQPPWLYHSKSVYPTYEPSYPEKHSWYPIPGPYTYGPPVHPTVYPDFNQDHPSLTQQIVHIHDGGLPDASQVDHYYEGNDYHIKNSITNIEYQDLAEVASSNVEIRKQKPKSGITQAPLRKKLPTNSSKRKSETLRRPTTQKNYSAKIRQSNLGKSKNVMTRRRVPSRIQEQFRRRTRPTRRTHSRYPNYNYYYNDYDNRRRYHERYDDDIEYGDYRNSGGSFSKQQDYYEDTSEASSTQIVTDIETTTTTTTAMSETTTQTPPTTMVTTTNDNTTQQSTPAYNFDFYGPSNGNENISITYGPPFALRNDFDTGNLWYVNQGSPNLFNYKDYLSQGGLIQ